MCSDGEFAEALTLGCDTPLEMNGRTIILQASRKIPRSIQDLLERNRVAAAEVSAFLMHQANLNLITRAAQAVGVPPEKFFCNLQRYGNTSSASLVDCGGGVVGRAGREVARAGGVRGVRRGVALGRAAGATLDRRTRRMENLSGKVALVTGSSRGIGRAIAIALARDGADVAINYRSRAADARDAESEIAGLGRRVVAVQADVAASADVERLVDEVRTELGPVDILVNNAGIARVQSIEEVTERDWDELLAVNLKSCFLVTQAVLPAMRARRWGRVINLSSVAAHVGGVVGAHYAASKAGMLGLTHFYASRLAKEGITVNAISPALVETEMVTANPNATPERIPVGRFGKVEEVAETAVMLARNGYITGQTLHVNGGWFMT